MLPGFVNTHTHADCVLLRGGISQDRSLFDWLSNVLDPARFAYTEDNIRLSVTLFCQEALLSGITTVVDNAGYFNEWNHAVALETFAREGLRVFYGPMFLDRIPIPNQRAVSGSSERSRSLPKIEETQEAFSRIETLFSKFHSTSAGRIRLCVAPRLGRAMSEAGLRRAAEMAEVYDTFTTTHCAETREESEGSASSTVEYLHQSGYLGPRTVLAHCVWANASDIEKISDSGAAVAHNPSTNLFLGSGIAPISEMLDAGIMVGLGTDNPNANNLVNMLTEMRAAALLQKARYLDAAAVTSEEALEMATIIGAKVLGMDNELGSLEAGKKADIVTLDINQRSFFPSHHYPAAIVYQSTGRDIDTVIVDGNRLVANGTIVRSHKGYLNELGSRAIESSLELLGRAKSLTIEPIPGGADF